MLTSKLKALKPYLLVILIVAISFSLLTGLVYLVSKDSSKIDNNSFTNCTELVNYINSNNSYGIGIDGRVEDTVGSSDGAESPSSIDLNYSKTNIQVEGLDESDLVKTDGKNIFILKERDLIALDSELNELDRVRLDFTTSDLYLSENKLVVLGIPGRQIRPFAPDILPIDGNLSTNINVYSFNNNKIEFEKEVKIEGALNTSRLKLENNTLYLVTSKYFYENEFDSDSIKDFIPKVQIDSVNYLAANCSDISKIGNNTNSFVTVVSFSLEDEEVNTKVLVGNVQTVYVSNDNLYIAATKYSFDSDEPFNTNEIETELYKFSLNGTDLNFENSKTLEGVLLNQFSLDEYNNYLRIVTSLPNRASNSLYVLNLDMDEVGSIHDFGLDESVQAVRFLNETAYVVTFRVVDPFFTIDLKDPTNPKLSGELKIPGYSSYLHPISNDFVIGIGKATDEFGSEKGIKVSLFDVSDLANPKLLDEIVYENTDNYFYTSEIFSNHRVFNYNAVNKAIALPISKNSRALLRELVNSTESIFELIQIEDNRLVKYISHEISDKPFTQNMRIFYIEDSYYFLLKDEVIKFSYLNKQIEKTVKF